ncbi:MAG: hypothetical protein U0167_19620 [bacterium]
MPFDRQNDHRLLERRLLQQLYLGHLAWLRERCDDLRETTSWPDAARQLGTPVPDRALLPILHSVREDGSAAWNPILLLLFWPTLERIYRRKRRRWGKDDDEFWTDVLANFSAAIARLDPEQRPERIAQKVFNDTARGLYLTCRRGWVVSHREVLAADEEPDLRLEVEHPDGRWEGEDADWRCDREFRRRHYLRLLRRHVIAPQDYLLLCGTRVCGWTIAVCAEGLGMTAESAKKRLQRVESRIRRLDPLR